MKHYFLLLMLFSYTHCAHAMKIDKNKRATLENSAMVAHALEKFTHEITRYNLAINVSLCQACVQKVRTTPMTDKQRQKSLVLISVSHFDLINQQRNLSKEWPNEADTRSAKRKRIY